jgi:small subunit ribosomal protein S16
MPVKMRLQRRGKKGNPFFHLVIADGRAPRDGKFIEKIGTYDPTTSPAQINLDFDLALSWLQKGAQPTDTMRAILSYKGVLYKYHLLKGVKKGALTEAQAEEKFQSWMKDKEARIAAKAQGIMDKSQAEAKARLEAETKVREAREAEFAKKRAAAEEAEAKAAAEKAAAEKAEAPAEESEAPAEETKEGEE